MKHFDVEEIYSAITQDGYRPPHRRAVEDVDLKSSRDPFIISQTGDPGNAFLTGICFQSPRASKYLSEGINPISGEEIENYEEVRELYLERLPDSFGILADQFRISGLERGELVVVIEDKEWPHKIMAQLEEAGIEFDKGETVQDIRSAYERMGRIFRLYVSEILENDIEIEFIYTSELQGRLNTAADPALRYTDAEDRRRIRTFFLTSSRFPGFCKEALGLSETPDMCDPVRYHPELYRGPKKEVDPYERANLRYYQRDDRDSELIFFPEFLSPWGRGSRREIRADCDKSLNTDTWKKLFQGDRDFESRSVLKDPVVRTSVAFPDLWSETSSVIELHKEEDRASLEDVYWNLYDGLNASLSRIFN